MYVAAMRISPETSQRSHRPASQAAKTVDRVRCVLARDGRYLLARHNSRRRSNRSRWGLAGGRVRDRENPQECLRREIMEELRCRVPDLVPLGDWEHRDETHRVFGCEIAENIETFDKEELRAIAWFTFAEVVELAAADRLRTGFELPAIAAFERQRASRRR
jgi:8-oxo-dGTP pyrophosphatase MutT (NUDIX family)